MGLSATGVVDVPVEQFQIAPHSVLQTAEMDVADVLIAYHHIHLRAVVVQGRYIMIAVRSQLSGDLNRCCPCTVLETRIHKGIVEAEFPHEHHGQAIARHGRVELIIAGIECFSKVGNPHICRVIQLLSCIGKDLPFPHQQVSSLHVPG